MTLELEVRCPFCKRKQRYLSYNGNGLPYLFGRAKGCVICGKTFKLKSATHDNIIRIVRKDRL